MSIRTALLGVLLLFQASSASAKDVPKLVESGEHLCKVSKEYKLRKCRVVQEGELQVLTLYEPGHLLNLEGVLYRNDFTGRSKKIFFEAKLKGEKPYICNVRDEAAAKACRDQTVMVTLERKGDKLIGSFPLKHYWDRWIGDGEARHINGVDVTVEELSFTLQMSK